MVLRAAWLVLLGAVGCGRMGFDVSELGGDGGVTGDAFAGRNVMFVSSTRTNGAFGGLAQADAFCAERAGAAGLPGTYVAYLSTTAVNAVDRLAGARGWVRPDGKPFADTREDIAAGRLFYPPMIDEHGDPVPSTDQTLTGSVLDGTLAELQNCNDYTDGNYLGSAGDAYAGTVSFSRTGNWDCDGLFHLYCFGIDSDTPIDPQPVGRLAFTTPWDNPTTGVAAADQMCQSAATSAGLAGSFRALIGTSTASAASRFNVNGPNWTRHDGLPLAPTPQALMAGMVDLPLARDATGAPGGEFVFTGGPPNAPAQSSCSDWTSSSGTGVAGYSWYAGGAAFTTTDLECFVSYGAVYCLEE